MAITLTNADSALKNYYLDAITEQLDYKTNPLLAQINKTSNYVYGKEVKKLVSFGLNGGIGAGTEDGSLPTSSQNNYAQMQVSLKNLYGTIEISDKAIRASENNAGAFVNLLTAEMEGLVKSSAINFGRMVFGDGSGILAHVAEINSGVITLDDVTNIVEGMIVDFRDSDEELITGATGRKILAVNRSNNTITVSGTTLTDDDVEEDSIVTVQGSFNNEITGLGAIFGSSSTLYGLTRSENGWLTPSISTSTGSITVTKMQSMLDTIEEASGNSTNLIICSLGVRRALIEHLRQGSIPMDPLELKGGFKSISYNGIPVVADRFCPKGKMYFLNTNDFELHQLCDWQWLEGDDGRILKQVAGKPVYTATLVKYADLMCSKPIGQGVLEGITE